MRRWLLLVPVAATLLLAGCSGDVIRAESDNREIEWSSPLLRQSLMVSLSVAALAAVGVAAWRLMRRRNR